MKHFVGTIYFIIFSLHLGCSGPSKIQSRSLEARQEVSPNPSSGANSHDAEGYLESDEPSTAQTDKSSKTADDTATTEIDVNLNDPYKQTVNQLKIPLSVSQLVSFVRTKNITTVAQLMPELPATYLKNSVLIYESKSRHQATKEQPRVILFGSDARFMFGISSNQADPLHDNIEMAELDTNTGFWKFRAISLGAKESFADNDLACRACHGETPTPKWGNYPDWPGVFGDHIGSIQTELIDAFKKIQTTEPLKHLKFTVSSDQSSLKFYLPERLYGFNNTVFNFELGSAAAEGLFIRLKNNNNYQVLRKELLYAVYCNGENSPAEVLAKAGIPGRDVNMGTLAGASSNSSQYNSDWYAGNAGLLDLVGFLALYELMGENETVKGLLLQHENEIQQLWEIDWKYFGEERQKYRSERPSYTTAGNSNMGFMRRITSDLEIRTKFCTSPYVKP